jgi:hypothetical protein
MKSIFATSVVFCLLTVIVSDCFSQEARYLWLDDTARVDFLIDRIATPERYDRLEVEPGSFEEWLRNLPLKCGNPQVYLYDGRPKSNQQAQYAVVEIDVGGRDLQQCADAVMRLRAEYLYSIGDYDRIHFNFTSGDEAAFRRWINGYRPEIDGNNVRWIKRRAIDSSYATFRNYLTSVFIYAGSYSLNRELNIVDNVSHIMAGDVFIEGGFPGHAVMVLDIAVNTESGEKIFLLAQSYMPAQDIHILKNPVDSALNPWYSTDFGEILITPEWRFLKSDLKRFK